MRRAQACPTRRFEVRPYVPEMIGIGNGGPNQQDEDKNEENRSACLR